MAINLYDFHDIIRETYNEYVSRYEIDLVDFKNEYGADSEPKFIEYQRVYLGKMRDYIIENLSKIDNEDLDSQFYHDKLQESLSDNKKMFHFLNVRLNPMNYIQEQKENTSKDEYLEFFENLNNNKITESGMIKFIKSHESIQDLETLIKDTDKFIENYIVGMALNNWEGFQFDEAYKRPLSEESFTTFKELVFNKIDELKSCDASERVKPEKLFKTMKEAILYHIFEHNGSGLKRTINTNDAKELAKKYGFISPTSGQQFREDYNVLVYEHNRIDKNLYPNKKSLTTIIDYYENVIRELPNQKKEKVNEELKILENFRDQFHKYN